MSLHFIIGWLGFKDNLVFYHDALVLASLDISDKKRAIAFRVHDLTRLSAPPQIGILELSKTYAHYFFARGTFLRIIRWVVMGSTSFAPSIRDYKHPTSSVNHYILKLRLRATD